MVNEENRARAINKKWTERYEIKIETASYRILSSMELAVLL